MDDRPANRATKLVAFEYVLGDGCGKEILGVEDWIAHKLKHIAVELVAARTGDNIHHAARALAVLRAVVAALYAEFLQGVGKRKWLVYVRVFVNVISAIELIAQPILP